MTTPTIPPTKPTPTAVIGKFTNASLQDIFQTFDGEGNLLANMNYLGAINTGGLISVVPQTIRVVISSAELLALNNTPVAVTPAPLPGKIIIPQFFSVIYTAGTVPYTITGSDGDFYLDWSGQTFGSDSLGLFPDTGLVDQTASNIFLGGCTSNGQDPLRLIANIINQPIVLGIKDSLSLGNGSLAIAIAYITVTP
jgi:hypothetical protein